MKCEEVQEKFSDYIEGVLPHEERVLIEEHLRSCPGCKRALSDLKKTIEYVQTLEEVEPPPGFTQKVMARIRLEAETKRGILQRLFYPLYIKLPLEAVAVALIATTMVYIFKPVQQEVSFEKGLSEELAFKSTHKREKFPAPREGGAPSEELISDEMEKLPVVKPKAPARALRKGEIQVLNTPQLGAKREAEGVLRFVLHVRDVEAASMEVKKVIVRLGGEIIKMGPLKNKYVIVARLDSQKTGGLLEALKRIGETKKETAPEAEGKVRVKIEFIKSQ